MIETAKLKWYHHCNIALKKKEKILKPLRATAPVFCSALIALCFAACGTGAASDGSDDPELDSRLIGTWTRSYSVDITDEEDDDEDGNYLEVIGTRSSETAIRFDSDGSYYSVSNDIEDYIDDEEDEFESDADKGTYSIESEGVLRITQEYDYTGTEPLALSTSIPGSAWIADGETVTYPYVLIDGDLYSTPWTRSGSGTGLVGTWECYIGMSESNSELDEWKMQYVITSSAIDRKGYKKNAEGDWDFVPSNSDSLTYEPDGSRDDRIIVTEQDGDKYYMEYAVKDGYLFFESDVHGLVKN
jgi:hypothetical protein